MATGLASGALVLDDVTDPAHPAARGRTPDTRTVSAGVVAPVFTPDGKRLVTAAADTPPTVWDVTAPDQPRIGATLSGPGAAALAVAPDGRTLAVATSGAVALWDIVDVPRRLATLPARAEAVSGLAFSAAGLLAVAGLDRVTQLWAVGDPAAPRLLGVAGGHTQGVTAVAFSPDGERMVTGGVDGTTRL